MDANAKQIVSSNLCHGRSDRRTLPYVTIQSVRSRDIVHRIAMSDVGAASVLLLAVVAVLNEVSVVYY